MLLYFYIIEYYAIILILSVNYHLQHHKGNEYGEQTAGEDEEVLAA